MIMHNKEDYLLTGTAASSLDVHNLDDRCISNTVQRHNGVPPLTVLELLCHYKSRLRANQRLRYFNISILGRFTKNLK